MVLAKTLSDIGLVEVKCVVANLRPSLQRAKLAKGTLKVLNMGDVPVAAGTDGNSDKHVDNFSESVQSTGHNYLAPYVSEKGPELLQNTYEAADAKSITFLLISSLTDAATFIRDHEALFLAKVRDTRPS